MSVIPLQHPTPELEPASPRPSASIVSPLGSDTCAPLVAVKGSRLQPAQRSFRCSPASRAMRSSSLGHT